MSYWPTLFAVALLIIGMGSACEFIYHWMTNSPKGAPLLRAVTWFISLSVGSICITSGVVILTR